MPRPTPQAIIAGCAFLGLFAFVGYALLFSTAVMGHAYQKSRWIEGTLAMGFGYVGIRLLFSKAEVVRDWLYDRSVRKRDLQRRRQCRLTGSGKAGLNGRYEGA
ncbi:MAG: hypothetical protein E5X80_08250 [Mesorhizobium sp.]|uniref:hypothetical protein n=1 Tax=Mesorhizobium sp. TaxID=1871066 RepID=UPI00121EAFA5|nr:hypothetical protein [Mesorhizobium sp.]TIO53871.1 MAG: hypothetical protein E5X78_05790 [Mesorhizobium sp.]TIO61498.1 MAG: hypothetical protein E5X79_06935 [Mesorhizobium sp.]TJV65884.1 MAG: hypothetical protein E5X80_08250 [Mesorhizobium sp.]